MARHVAGDQPDGGPGRLEGLMIGQIGIVTLRVDHWDAMMKFYRDRVGLTPVIVDETNQYVMFDTGAVRLALEGSARPAHPRAAGRPAMMLNFQSANLPDTIEALEAEGGSLLRPLSHGPGDDRVVFGEPEGKESG